MYMIVFVQVYLSRVGAIGTTGHGCIDFQLNIFFTCHSPAFLWS